MKKISIFLLLTLASCASCQLVKDLADSPSKYEQERILTSINGVAEVGINGTISDTKIYVRSYGKGSVLLRGMEDCGFLTSLAIDKMGWVVFDTAKLINREFCLYTLQATTQGFDSPAIGHVLVRRFLDPNVLPLKTVVNGVEREGVNWVQLKEGSISPLKAYGGIFESRDITLKLGGHSGKLNITDCDNNLDVTDYTDAQDWKTSVDYLYRKITPIGIKKSCSFMITANHNDTLKESATIFVGVYKTPGSFLDAPLVNIGKSDACFEFTDPYAIGIRVNGDWAKSKGVCVDKAARYVVEGVTSRHRVFYGEHNGLDWEVMK